MIELNEVNHASVVNASLTKIYNNARITGKLNSIDIYILNVLFKLINDCNLVLTHDQKKRLQCIYRQLYNTSPDICKVQNLQSYRTPSSLVTDFIIAEVGDKQTDPLVMKIYYWQELTPYTGTLEIANAIINDNYLDDKPFASKLEFEFGIDVPLKHIGRVVFAVDPGFASGEFVITDWLGNDITHAFAKTTIVSMNIVIFVSSTFHSHGILNVHIKQTAEGTPNTNIFTVEFNNIFS